MGNLSSLNNDEVFNLCCSTGAEDDMFLDRNTSCSEESIYQRTRQNNRTPSAAHMILGPENPHEGRNNSWSTFQNTNDKALYHSSKSLAPPTISMQQDAIRSFSSVSSSASSFQAAAIPEEKRRLERGWEEYQETIEGRNDIQGGRCLEAIVRGLRDDEIRTSASSLDEHTRDIMSSYYASTSRHIVYFGGIDQ